MKGFRFYLALYSAKFTSKMLTLMHRNGTHLPGVIALKICPDFFKRMDKPKTIIGVTGTNGKTTTANMIIDLLQAQGYNPVNNRTGSNILGGVATALISSVNLTGKTVNDIAVLELDERASRFIYPHVHPTYLVCTNLFRDSFKRNAHSEFIFDILDKNIPPETTLILNADDPVSARLAKNNKRAYFGIDPQKNEILNQQNLVQDTPLCPECGASLEYYFRRYHHIGRAKCSKCSYSVAQPDYCVTEVNNNTGRMNVNVKGKNIDFKMTGANIIDTYNLVAVIALFSEFGMKTDELQKAVENLEIAKIRYDEVRVNDKQIVMRVAKSQNPVACSRVFDSIRQHKGKKAVVLMVDDIAHAAKTSESVAWLYDVDFDFLNDDSVVQIVCSGKRRYDFKTRLLVAGIPEEKIVCIEKETNAAKAVNLEKVDTVFLLYDVYTVNLAEISKNTIISKLNGKEVNDDEN